MTIPRPFRISTEISDCTDVATLFAAEADHTEQFRRSIEIEKGIEMYAQLVYFDGPRSVELVAAIDRANVERIGPAIMADPWLKDELVANYALRRPDGGEVNVTIVKSEEALRRGQQVVMSTELLPGEDPALLPGPDRIEIYEVVNQIPGNRTS